MRALITGITGQDGTYLAELLCAEGYEVHGTSLGGDAVVPLPEHVVIHEVDQRSSDLLRATVHALRPDEVHNLAALSSVGASWVEPELTAQVNAVGATALLQACWELHETGHDVRFVQASSAEIFGQPEAAVQDESTPIAPVNPYGAAKAFAHHMVSIYRARGLHASTGILYNHESPRRPETFVTRKITASVARISRGQQDTLVLGNLEARRDWGWAPDYVRALHLVGRAERPSDYVVATGQAHSVRDLVDAAFAAAGIDKWEHLVTTSPEFYRPVDAWELVGDATRARRELGWRPTLTFRQMASAMVQADLEALA